MNENYQLSYYSITPATVRYDTRLKPAEKLLYGEITALTNSMGYCFATNKYFANLYNVTPHTVSQWISHIEKCGYIYLEFIRGPNGNIKERRIYIIDLPYVQKNTYPYVLKNTYPMYKNVQYNNIDIDDLFYLIIKKSNLIPSEFLNIIEKFEFYYSNDIIVTMQEDKVDMLKIIFFVLFDIFNTNDYKFILNIIERDKLLNLYYLSKEHNPADLLSYYRKTIINTYTNT